MAGARSGFSKRLRVQLFAQDSEMYVFSESVDRINKERSLRHRQLKWLWGWLKETRPMRRAARCPAQLHSLCLALRAPWGEVLSTPPPAPFISRVPPHAPS